MTYDTYRQCIHASKYNFLKKDHHISWNIIEFPSFFQKCLLCAIFVVFLSWIAREANVICLLLHQNSNFKLPILRVFNKKQQHIIKMKCVNTKQMIRERKRSLTVYSFNFFWVSWFSSISWILAKVEKLPTTISTIISKYLLWNHRKFSCVLFLNKYASQKLLKKTRLFHLLGLAYRDEQVLKNAIV